MANIEILKAEPRHYADILALNKELVHFLAEMDMELMLEITAQCCLFLAVEVDGEFAGFLLGLEPNTAYEGVNYKWFEEQYDSFLYIDRIVLSPKFHGMGVGTKVYEFIFDYAKGKGIPRVTAEIDIAPPNPTSLAFHKAKGFEEVGILELAYANKKVSLQCAQV